MTASVGDIFEEIRYRYEGNPGRRGSLRKDEKDEEDVEEGEEESRLRRGNFSTGPPQTRALHKHPVA